MVFDSRLRSGVALALQQNLAEAEAASTQRSLLDFPQTRLTARAAIQIYSLCRYYSMGSATIRAVDGISLAIDSGEFVALLGASGSGKSSLLNLIAGLDSATSGSITVADRNLAALSRDELARYRRHTVGMVFQSFNLVPSMTVVENVELPLRFAEVERSKRGAMAVKALERVGLSGRLGHRPIELSGGEQQRVALARALINQPSILLADEPTGNLDSRTGTEVMELIRKLNESLQMTVVLVTHERDLAEKYADRLISLADGKVVGEQTNPARAMARGES
jgi:putative ABC transport system ATP-binding protein